MLVRAGNDGEWLQLRPVEGVPAGGLRSLCGSDAANLLELDSPLPVVAYGPWPAGSPDGIDAVCLTPDGGIELLVGTWGESPRDTMWRLLDAAGALRGSSLEAFAAHCTELGAERSVTRWLHGRVGGDATSLELNLSSALERGDFGFVLVTSNGAGDLAQPMQFLEQLGAKVRVFEVEILRAGDVQAIEGIEVPLAQSAGQAERPAGPAPQVTRRPAPELVAVPDLPAVVEQRSQPDVAVEPVAEAAPQPQPQPESESEPEPREPVAEVVVEPEAASTPEIAMEQPSEEPAFLAAVDRLDHRTSAHLRWLHGALQRLVDELEYTTDGVAQHLTGWIHGSERAPLFGLDSNGVLQLVLASLPEHEQAEYANEVAGMLPEADGEALRAAGYVGIDIPAYLDDQTLLEYLVDNLMEALPGGREAFGTVPSEQLESDPEGGAQLDDEADLDTAGDDFFAGVSGGHDPDELPSMGADFGAVDTSSTASDEDEATDEPAAPVDWADRPGDQKAAGSRWLRRRGAA